MRHSNDDLGTDDLTPVDGVSDIHIEFDGMRAHSGSPPMAISPSGSCSAATARTRSSPP